MKILNWYVTRGFLVSFFMAIGVLTFTMTGANVVKVLGYVSQGIPVSSFLLFALYILPNMLTYTVPWAVMVAVMLVFGRLSADSEITAMRACGISIMQIVSPIMLFTVALTMLCLYLQADLGPPLMGEARQMLKLEAIEQPTAIFEPGRMIKYDNTIISIDDKFDGNQLRGIQIFTASGGQDISAARGEMTVDKANQQLIVKLFDCVIIDKSTKPETRLYNEEAEFSFNYGQQMNRFNITVAAKYMDARELMAFIRITQRANKDTTKLEVELNQRIAFALSPIAFLLLGLPLAIRTSRKETSAGLFLSVILAGSFSLLIVFCESLVGFSWLYPQYLLWLPNIVFQVIGAVMTYRISNR